LGFDLALIDGHQQIPLFDPIALLNVNRANHSHQFAGDGAGCTGCDRAHGFIKKWLMGHLGRDNCRFDNPLLSFRRDSRNNLFAAGRYPQEQGSGRYTDKQSSFHRQLH